MTTPFWCVLGAFMLIMVARICVIVASIKQFGKLDNRRPRDQQRGLDGWGARAQAAQNNGFESFPFFAAGVFVAHLAGADAKRAGMLSITYLVTRVLYLVAYLLDLDYLRTAIWFMSFLVIICLFVLGAV